MASSPLKEIFSDVTLIVDPTLFKDPDRVRAIVRGYKYKTKESSYEAHGSFEEMEDLFVKLSGVARHSPAMTYERQRPHHHAPPPPPQAQTVTVADRVWDYIQNKRSEELQRIQGNDVELKVQKSLGKTEVTFRPQGHGASLAWRAHFTRERFITFYQRIATDLKVVSCDLSPHSQGLETEFPELLIADGTSKQTAIVTGPYASIARLEDFLRNGGISTQRQRKEAQGASEGASAASPEYNSRQLDQDEPCAICMDTIEETERKILACKHSFCRDCLKRAFEFKPACPTCGELYGVLRGTQPEGGTMDINKRASSLPGYENYGTIVIHYNIPSGIQKEEHPSPGHRYEGASRIGYLPDCPEGRKVLGFLKRAFDQRLVFTVGRSSTSGRHNVVTWNDIHHKTSTHGGPSSYGYPDPDYLRRVQDELKVKGIK